MILLHGRTYTAYPFFERSRPRTECLRKVWQSHSLNGEEP